LGNGEWGARKKLEAAALHWTQGGKPAAQPVRVDDGVAKGLRRLGVNEADIERAQASEVQAAKDEDFEVHEDCWENWQFFMRVKREWVYVSVTTGLGAMAVRTGLNWPGIESVVRLSGIKRAQWAQLVDDLMVIQEAVLKADR
jgi:hypothetical protein